MREILIQEDLLSMKTDSWILDFERNIVSLKEAQTRMVEEYIRALDGINNANVIIVYPKDRISALDQDPVFAITTIIPTLESDILENHKKIEYIQKMLKFSVRGLKDENIVITDQNGTILNEFEGLMYTQRRLSSLFHSVISR